MEEKEKRGLHIKCYKEKCEYVWEYKGVNLFKTTCPKCGGTIYLPKGIITKHEYNKRLKLWQEIVKEYKKKFDLE